MTHDDELIERAAKVLHAEWMPEEGKFEQNSEDYREAFRDAARKLVTVVRAYDAERRASVLDADALKTFDPKSPGTLVWLPDGLNDAEMSAVRNRVQEIIAASLADRYDPDDYRDLPVAMTEPVRFKGGLTEGK